MKELTCQKAKLLAVLSVYGELDSRGEQLYKRHTDKCPACEAELKSMQILRNSVDSIENKDVPDELLGKIKADSGEILAAEKKHPSFGRIVLKPGLALLAFGIIIFALVYTRPVEYPGEIVLPEDNDYRLIDERLVEAENSLQAINLDLLAGLNDF